MTTNELQANRRNWESVLLPIVLMLLGISVLAGADFGYISLDRTKDLWPLAIILVGLAEIIPADSPARRNGRDQ